MAEILVSHPDTSPRDIQPPLYSTQQIRWGAIMAGLIVATAVQVVLALLGLAVGLAAFDPRSSAGSFGLGAGLWTIVSALIALFVGGMTAGRLSGVLTQRSGFLHGVVLWALSTLLTVWLLSRGLGALFGGALNLTGNLVGGAANAAGAVASAAVNATTGNDANLNLDFSAIGNEIERTLRQTGDPALNPDSLKRDARSAGQVTTGGADNAAAAREIRDMLSSKVGNVDRNDVLNVLTARTDLSRAEAEQLADRVSAGAADVRSRANQLMADVRQKAPAALESAASATSSGLWLALLALGLTLAATTFGTMYTARD